MIAVGYMSNAAVQVAQTFTADHDLAAKALRLPRGSLSTMDSPYLYLDQFGKRMASAECPAWKSRWCQTASTGFAESNSGRSTAQPMDASALDARSPGPRRLGPDYGSVYHSMPTMSPRRELRQ